MRKAAKFEDVVPPFKETRRPPLMSRGRMMSLRRGRDRWRHSIQPLVCIRGRRDKAFAAIADQATRRTRYINFRLYLYFIVSPSPSSKGGR